MDNTLTPVSPAVSLITFDVPLDTTITAGIGQTAILTTTDTEHAYFTGGAIKAIGINGDGKIGGYLVPFGSPTLRDSHQEYFHAGTDYALDFYPERPILFHHGLGNIEAMKIGVIYKITPDDKGLYAEAVLDVNH